MFTHTLYYHKNKEIIIQMHKKQYYNNHSHIEYKKYEYPVN